MNQRKRWLSLVLAILMVLVMPLSVLAQGEDWLTIEKVAVRYGGKEYTLVENNEVKTTRLTLDAKGKESSLSGKMVQIAATSKDGTVISSPSLEEQGRRENTKNWMLEISFLQMSPLHSKALEFTVTEINLGGDTPDPTPNPDPDPTPVNPSPNYLKKINDIVPGLVTHYTNTSEDWSAMAMVAGGKGGLVNESTLLNNDLGVITEALKKKVKATDLERTGIALTSLGYDIRFLKDTNGNPVNIIEELGNWSAFGGGMGTLNAYIFGLITYDSGTYPDPSGKWKREAIKNYILNNRLSDGGWNLNNEGTSDVDITAMAISALAPYYGEPKVRTAVDGALAWLDSVQITQGPYAGAFSTSFAPGSGGAQRANSNSTAMVIVALTALGKDPTTTITTPGGKNSLDGLLSFYLENPTVASEKGLFGYTDDKSANGMATEQAFRALIATKNLWETGKGNVYRFPAPTKKLADTVLATNLTIVTKPKTEYTQGDPMSLSGLTLTLTYSNGTTKTLGPDDVTISQWDTVTTGHKVAKITYQGLTSDLTYHVKEKETPSTGTADPVLSGDYAYISVVDPKGKTYQAKKAFKITPGVDTAFSLLQKTGLTYKYNYHPVYAGVYVSSIEGLAEFDKGEYSGWMYRVNGVFPNYSSSLRHLQKGDYVEWLYTRDLGKDVGGYVEGVENDDGTGNIVHYVTVRTPEGGTISPFGKTKVSKKAPVTFTITPNEGYVVEDVLLGGVSQGPLKTITIGELDKDIDLEAKFKKADSLTAEEKKALEEKQKEAQKIQDQKAKDMKQVGKTQVPVDQNPVGTFKDLAGHWAKEDIRYVYEKGYFNGLSNTEFGPQKPMTRGMFVTVLGRMAGAYEPDKNTGFQDVPKDKYYAPYVNWARKNGIVKGTSKTTFSPNKAISREEMATFLNRYLTVMGKGKTEEKPTTFTDKGTIAPWAKEGVQQLTGLGILNGLPDGSFKPQGKATRAQVAKVVAMVDKL